MWIILPSTKVAQNRSHNYLTTKQRSMSKIGEICLIDHRLITNSTEIKIVAIKQPINRDRDVLLTNNYYRLTFTHRCSSRYAFDVVGFAGGSPR